MLLPSNQVSDNIGIQLTKEEETGVDPEVEPGPDFTVEKTFRMSQYGTELHSQSRGRGKREHRVYSPVWRGGTVSQ